MYMVGKEGEMEHECELGGRWRWRGVSSGVIDT